jgi:hypothetical protein
MPFLPELVPILERHGHLNVDPSARAHLLSMSVATADRMVRRVRDADRPHGISTTKPGRLLKRQVGMFKLRGAAHSAVWKKLPAM